MSEQAKNVIIVILIVGILALIGVITFVGGDPARTETQSETMYETNTSAPQSVNGSTN